MVRLHDIKEIREMIRELMLEMHKKNEIYFTNGKEVYMIVERIIYKIDPNNMPDIEELKQLIEKETGFR